MRPRLSGTASIDRRSCHARCCPAPMAALCPGDFGMSRLLLDIWFRSSRVHLRGFFGPIVARTSGVRPFSGICCRNFCDVFGRM